MIIDERDDGIRLLHIRDHAEAAPYKASFAGAYQDVFAGPPYHERFFPSEAMGVLDRFLDTPDHITLLAVRGRTHVVGFGIAVPMPSRPEISRSLRGLVPVEHTFYLAELGVLESYRGRGLGRALVRGRIDRMDVHRFTHVVLRVSASRNASYEMYVDLGFDDMGVYMEVPRRRLDGSVTSDRRLFLSKVLSRSDAQLVGDEAAKASAGASWGTGASDGS